MSFERRLRVGRQTRSLSKYLAWSAVFVASCAHAVAAQSAREFHRTFSVSLLDPIALNVQLSKGDLEVGYSRDGQVVITALAQTGDEQNLPADVLSNLLLVESNGNRIEIRERPLSGTPKVRVKLTYRIDVPYRTEVHSILGSGKQTIIGIMGPVMVETEKGDIQVSYVSKGVTVQAGTGNLNLEVIGEHVDAKTGAGNIACTRADRGVNAETEEGDISLMVVGPSTATVKSGTGRIDAGGLRGTLVASTDAGDLHVRAVPHGDWQLTTVSGTVRVELPPASEFEIDATTTSGDISVHRDDLERPDMKMRHFTQKANRGGKRIQLRTTSGTIVVM